MCLIMIFYKSWFHVPYRKDLLTFFLENASKNVRVAKDVTAIHERSPLLDANEDSTQVVIPIVAPISQELRAALNPPRSTIKSLDKIESAFFHGINNEECEPSTMTNSGVNIIVVIVVKDRIMTANTYAIVCNIENKKKIYRLS